MQRETLVRGAKIIFSLPGLTQLSCFVREKVLAPGDKFCVDAKPNPRIDQELAVTARKTFLAPPSKRPIVHALTKH
jgi:hypothetical protein